MWPGFYPPIGPPTPEARGPRCQTLPSMTAIGGHSSDVRALDDRSQGITRSVTSTNSASTHPAATNSSTMATA